MSEDFRYDITAALTEACGNAIRHAGTAGDYGVALMVTGETCTVEVSDEGVGFTATGTPVQPSPAHWPDAACTSSRSSSITWRWTRPPGAAPPSAS
ncbi:hypothetical protein Phou_076920 [Phytohabitans houttuyneae]|uniref:Histidine kinase/HSP90-like ATPase domain-containing protein n=1 Tax=Phytohabitans houttuyneae TaxID=1076126 RepID=A0A6V8KE56_9ACTN|nr:hypothetical protein Phou_076920 [Phytohabitans houttuyneae]